MVLINSNVIANDNDRTRYSFRRNSGIPIVYNRDTPFSPISDNDVESAENNTLSVDYVEKIDFNEIAKEGQLGIGGGTYKQINIY